MNMIYTHSHVYDLNIKLFTGFPDDFFRRFRLFPRYRFPLRPSLRLFCLIAKRHENIEKFIYG